jgi:hypothetical protein
MTWFQCEKVQERIYDGAVGKVITGFPVPLMHFAHHMLGKLALPTVHVGCFFSLREVLRRVVQ